MAKVVILTFTEVTRDPRVMRHVRALSRDHEIVTCGKGLQPTGAAQHLEIPSRADHLPTTPKGLIALALRRSSWAYRNLPASQEAKRLLENTSFDVLVSNDIAALPVALEAAAGRPVLADLHEFAPKEMEENRLWRLMVQPFFKALCQEFLPRATAVTTVTTIFSRIEIL